MGWVIACFLAMGLLQTLSQLRRLQRSMAEKVAVETTPAPRLPLAYQNLQRLIVLRLELNRWRQAGALEPARYLALTERIDTLCMNLMRHLGTVPQRAAWQQDRNAAWELLRAQSTQSERPPWQEDMMSSVPTEERQVATVSLPPPLPPAPAQRLPVSPSLRTPPRSLQPPPLPPQAVPTLQVPPAPLPPPSTSPREAADYAWRPAAPNVLERTLRTMAGWPAMLAPFLLQNIGWFIGGLCFVAGSIFLVAYTSGFAKTLTSFTVLSLYTLLLLCGGYQIRRRQPALEMSSHALLMFGMMLLPLNVAAAVRLLLAAPQAPGLLALGILVTALGVGVLYATATVVSGMMDRALQRQHPRLFLALSSLQLAIPVIAIWPVWPVIVICHALLVGILAYGLQRFTHDWLHAVFIERRKLAYYAAGTLVYAAVVTFIHVTVGYAQAPPLPRGYYGPFLIVLCSLLCYVDAHCKRWAQHAAWLSHLSFGLYGLSIIALLLAQGNTLTLLLTLAYAMVLYGFVTWHYATLAPLYLLLGCAGWFYGEVVLRHVAYDWYFLASVPALAGLWAANRWLLQRHAMPLALIGYRLWLLVLALTAAWSLWHGQPGGVALATAIMFMGVALTAPALLPPLVFGSGRNAQLLLHLWLYCGTGAGMVAAVYTPVVLWLGREEQILYSLVFLAALWTALGLRLSRKGEAHVALQCAALLNSAVLYLVLGLGMIVILAVLDLPHSHALPLVLAVEGGLALSLSLTLGVQWLFYGTLGLWGLAGVLVKLLYFPLPGSGVTLFVLAGLVWLAIWWVERVSPEVIALRQDRAAHRVARNPARRLLGVSPVTFAAVQMVVRQPLRQAMVVLWGVGLGHLGRRLMPGQLSWSLIVSASLGTLLTLLLAGVWPQPWLLPIAMTVGLSAAIMTAVLLGISTVLGASVMVVAYALLAWWLGARSLEHPGVRRWAQWGHLHGDTRLLESLLHWTAFIMVAVGVGLPLIRHDLFVPHLTTWLLLGIAMVFWGLAGQRYHLSLHRYLVVESAVLAAGIAYIWTSHPLFQPVGLWWQHLLSAPDLGLLLVLLNASLWGIAWFAWRQTTSGDTVLSRYGQLLRVVAVQLAVLAALQALGFLAPTVLGLPYHGGFLGLAVLGLAGLSLLCTRQTGWSLLGMLSMVLAMLGLQSLWLHGTPLTALWLGHPVYTDQWCTLALLALGLASVANAVRQETHWAHGFLQALQTAASGTYAWACLGAVVLMSFLPHQEAPALPWLFFLLVPGLLPWLQPLQAAATVRGVGIAVLLSAGMVSLLAHGGWQWWEYWALVAWGYSMWGLSNFVLPWYNTRWPRWAIAAEAWPWLGLILAGGALCVVHVSWTPASWPHAWSLGSSLLAISLYLFLLLRNTAWQGMPWCAVGTLSLAGFWMSLSGLSLSWSGLAGTIAWANVLLLGVTAWRHYGTALRRRLGWQEHNLSMPLLASAAAMLTLGLIALGFWDAQAILFTGTLAHPLDGMPALFFGLFVLLSFWHVYRLHDASWPVHASMAALCSTLFAMWTETAGHTLHLPLFLALWSVLLVGIAGFGRHYRWSTHPLDVVDMWRTWSPLVAIVVWARYPDIPLAEHLAILAFLGGYAGGLGWQRQQSQWLFVAMLATVVQLHGWWFVYLSPRQIAVLWPWCTVQLVVLTSLVLWARGRLQRWESTLGDRTSQHGWQTVPVQPVLQALEWLLPCVLGSVVLTWGLHLLYVLSTVWLGLQPQWLLGWGDSVAVILAMAALMAAGIQQTRRTAQTWWFYSAILLGATVWVYLRVLWVGFVAPQVWDTVALIAASYALFLLHRVTQSPPLLRVVMVLPLLAVVTVPMQVASFHASVALWVIALLYLGLRQTTGSPLSFSLALLTLNAGLYLWVPTWAHTARLLQLYIIPAAISVLALLHGHRQELRPSVLHACRLAAVSILYTSTTLDVFLQADVGIFLAALGISLVGIILGIALRTRAFLYAGTSFFVLNVVGQLLLFFPEQRLARAIVLLTLGTLITGSMIWFNMQREAILRRIRLARTDLTTWA